MRRQNLSTTCWACSWVSHEHQQSQTWWQKRPDRSESMIYRIDVIIQHQPCSAPHNATTTTRDICNPGQHPLGTMQKRIAPSMHDMQHRCVGLTHLPTGPQARQIRDLLGCSCASGTSDAARHLWGPKRRQDAVPRPRCSWLARNQAMHAHARSYPCSLQHGSAFWPCKP